MDEGDGVGRHTGERRPEPAPTTQRQEREDAERRKRGDCPSKSCRRPTPKGSSANPSDPIPRANFQPASLDLRLGTVAHRLRCSFLPHGRSVSDRLEEMAMDSFHLEQGAVLEVNRPYLVPLVEGLRLPPELRARANPRSSTGRLDIFTRVVTDHSHRFDDIAAGYHGPLHLEVVSRSFTIRVQRGAVAQPAQAHPEGRPPGCGREEMAPEAPG